MLSLVYSIGHILYYWAMELHTRHPHLYASQAQRGLLCIRNLQTNRIHLVKSEDLASLIKATRFSLDMGTYPHPLLQSEYEEIGLELFSIDVYQIADEQEDLDALLERCTSLLMQEGTLFY